MVTKAVKITVTLAAIFVFSTGCSSNTTNLVPTIPAVDDLMMYDGWLSSSLNDKGLPQNDLRIFSVDSPAIYFTVYISLGCCDNCLIYWTSDGEIIEQDFLEKEDVMNYVGYFTASLTRPDGGFKPGKYAVYSSKTFIGEEVVFWIITE